jgi:uncharacterized glyoxalase superfamily protein PhnB
MSKPTPAFSGVHLFVRDMRETVRFYRTLGLTIPASAEHHVHMQFDVGEGVTIAFGSFALTRGYDPAWREPSGGSPNSLQFALPSREAVDDVHRALVDAGFTSHLAPFDAFWGARYAAIDDPDGNVVGLQSPIDPAMKSPPPVD